MKPLARTLAEWVADLRREDLPDSVTASLKDRLLDTVGICFAGRASDAGIAALTLATEWGSSDEASVCGSRQRLPAHAAAMVNGTYAHSLDFDDTHLPSVVHPSAPLIPAILAAAEAAHGQGTDALVALAAAYEVDCRLAMAQYDAALGNSVFFEHGLHATSILGAVAGAAACARIRGLDASRIEHAIGIAASMGAGLIEANRAGGSVKKFHGGWAAHCAVVAAGMAAHGLTGPPTVLDGRFGLFRAFCGDRWSPDAIIDALGTRWETPGIFFKPYPCNHFTHAIADAALALRSRGLRAADVAAVEIGTARASLRTIGEPVDEKRSPRSPYHAAFSGPFVFATALCGGSGLGVGHEDFTEGSLRDPERRRISQLCTVVEDAECNAVFPHRFPAVVTVATADGRVLSERVMDNLGGPTRPLSRAQLMRKLSDNSGALAPVIADTCARFEELSDVGALWRSEV